MLLLLLAAPVLFLQDRAETLLKLVTFEKVEPADDAERRVLETLTRRENWLEAFRAVEAKLGPFVDGLAIHVSFDWPGDDYAHGGAGPVKGWVRFNLRKLAEYQGKIDALEKQRKDEEKKGRRLVFKVPPARFDRMIWHELSHVLQRGLEAPDWFKEGMAVWTADDPNCLAAFAAAGKKAEPVDSPLSDRNDTYARGHLFWKWLDSKGLVRKVVDPVVSREKGWKKALEEATALPWDKLVAAEQEWSAKELETLRPKPR